MPELLAPAGGPDQLNAALRFGADAVYLACDKFGMRARADNFSLDAIPAAVSAAHAKGCKVHAALNVLMRDSDMGELAEYMQALDAAGVDAFIIGDIGAFALAKRVAPRVELHVSTQESVCNAEACRMWYELGAARIVCAREMSIADIARMRELAPPELAFEAFVHGAMCMAYSGRCLLSSVMTGRSANKGACAQSCRWSYSLVEEQRPGEYFPIEESEYGSFILNAQDLNMVAHLSDLASAGVESFKIEGRNKRAFYVAACVKAYRTAIDGGNLKEAEELLECISHRPYGTGFFYGRANQSPMKDGYIKSYDHVASVMGCEATSEGRYRVTVRCQNRFFERDVLKALTLQEGLPDVQVSDICLLVPSDGGLPFVERSLDFEEVCASSYEAAVPLANRASEYYRFTCDNALQPGDYLIRRRDA